MVFFKICWPNSTGHKKSDNPQKYAIYAPASIKLHINFFHVIKLQKSLLLKYEWVSYRSILQETRSSCKNGFSKGV